MPHIALKFSLLFPYITCPDSSASVCLHFGEGLVPPSPCSSWEGPCLRLQGGVRLLEVVGQGGEWGRNNAKMGMERGGISGD